MPLNRFAAFILSLLCLGLLLASCKSVPGSNAVDVSRSVQTPFTASAAITLNELQAKATLERLSGADCIVSFTSPEALSGVVMQLKDEELIVSLNGISFTLSQKHLPASPVPQLLSHILGSAGTQANKAGGGVAELTGMSETGGYSILIDIDTGAILEIAAPEAGFAATLSDFSFVNTP